MRTKLIMVEGIPGSGKTSTARFIDAYLRDQGLHCELFEEGNLDHPADCESMAYFTSDALDEFVSAFEEHEDIIRSAVLTNGVDFFLSYGKLSRDDNLPDEVITAMRKFDVYELPSDRFCDLILQRWDEFTAYQAERNSIVIFECCYLQNAFTQLFIKNGESKEYTFGHIRNVGRTIEKLNPILIYLNPTDVSETITKASLERSQEWLDFVVWYHTQQGYGRTRGLHGTDGYVEVLAARQSLELEFLRDHSIQVVQIDNPQTNWSEAHRAIREGIQL